MGGGSVCVLAAGSYDSLLTENSMLQYVGHYTLHSMLTRGIH